MPVYSIHCMPMPWHGSVHLPAHAVADAKMLLPFYSSNVFVHLCMPMPWHGCVQLPVACAKTLLPFYSSNVFLCLCMPRCHSMAAHTLLPAPKPCYHSRVKQYLCMYACVCSSLICCRWCQNLVTSHCHSSQATPD